MLVKAIAVGPLEGYRIWVRFDDGTSGELDLSDIATQPMGKPWKDRRVFETVHVGDIGEIIWYSPPVDIDLCPEWAYTEITGVTRDELAARLGVKGPGPIRRWQVRRWTKPRKRWQKPGWSWSN